MNEIKFEKNEVRAVVAILATVK